MRHSQGGFTIIETMIYLAIAGITFAASIGFLTQRQRSNQFNQSVRELESSINDISNNTSTGVYPFIDGVECQLDPMGEIQFVAKSGAKPGENNVCMFVGTAVQLVSSDISGPDSDYYVHTLVGKKNISGPSNFANATPVVLHQPARISEIGSIPPALSIPWDTTIKKAYYTDSATNTLTDIYGIGYIYSNFGSNTTSTSNKSGSADVALYALVPPSPPAEKSITDFINEIDFKSSPGAAARYVPVRGLITICLVGADESKQAMIELGGLNNSLGARSNYQVSAGCL